MKSRLVPPLLAAVGLAFPVTFVGGRLSAGGSPFGSIGATASAAPEEKKEEDEHKPKVKVAPVTRSFVSNRLVCYGYARGVPGSDVVLAARVAAVVSQVLKRVGDKIAAGEVVVRLDARPFAWAREKAEGALAEAQSELSKGNRGVLAIE